MNRYILILLAAALGGCKSDQTRVEPASIEGLKISDLMSSSRSETEPTVSFMVGIYLVDPEQAQAARFCADSLTRQSIRFTDEKVFAENGFFASAGQGVRIRLIEGCLTQAGARRFGQTSLVLNPGFEAPFGEVFINEPYTVLYHSAQEGPESISLANGTLGWFVKARPDPVMKRLVQTTVEPVFMPWGVANWPGAERLINQLSRRFEACRFKVLLGPADFVVLGPLHETVEEMSSLERLLFVQPGKTEMLRYYVMVCLGITN